MEFSDSALSLYYTHPVKRLGLDKDSEEILGFIGLAPDTINLIISLYYLLRDGLNWGTGTKPTAM